VERGIRAQPHIDIPRRHQAAASAGRRNDDPADSVTGGVEAGVKVPSMPGGVNTRERAGNAIPLGSLLLCW
jgi:hypothetical protein